MRSPSQVHIVIHTEVGGGRRANRKVCWETETKSRSRHEERRKTGCVGEQVLDPDIRRTKVVCSGLSCAYPVPGDAEGIHYGWAHDKGVSKGQRLSHVIRAGASRGQHIAWI